jgi:hypothetical protein
MVNFKAIQKLHKKIMYHDKCDIYKYEAETKSNGAKSTKKVAVPIESDVPCKISFNDRIWDTFHHNMLDVTPYQKQPKIFMEVEHHVESGYYIEARRYDPGSGELLFTYKGQAGVPQVFLTHQEILLDMRGDN